MFRLTCLRAGITILFPSPESFGMTGMTLVSETATVVSIGTAVFVFIAEVLFSAGALKTQRQFQTHVT